MGDVQEKITKAEQHVCDLSEGKEKWTMRVPVNEERDSDCVIMGALAASKNAISCLQAENQALRQAAKRVMVAMGILTRKAAIFVPQKHSERGPVLELQDAITQLRQLIEGSKQPEGGFW